MNAIAIGTPLVDPYGSTGYVGAILPPTPGTFVIGRGMAPVRAELECIFPTRVSILADGIAAPMIERAQHIPPVTEGEIPALRAAAEAAQAAARRSTQDAMEASERRRAAFLVEAREKTPEWAAAVIVAEMVEDQSDSMSDYFGHTTTRTIILAFSRHKRDLFPEMRKAALNHPEVAHLATAPEDAEHREKYSMGGGFYLKEGYRHSNGWRIQKSPLYRGAESVPVGEWALSPATEEAEPVAAAAQIAGGHSITEHTHTKRGFQMWIVQLSGRVERAEYDRLLIAAKARGGWYSRAWGGTPAGFAFKAETAARDFAAAELANGETVQ